MTKERQATAGSLQALLRAEKEIQDMFQSESKRAASWLSQRREKILRNRNQTLLALRKALLRDRRAAEAEIMDAIERLRETAHKSAATLSEIGEEQIRSILIRHLAKLVPENDP